MKIISTMIISLFFFFSMAQAGLPKEVNFALDERIKAEVLRNGIYFSKLIPIPVNMITEDELSHCYGRISSNAEANLVGSCYFSENGSLYILAITEKITKNFKIIYPIYQVMQITSEL